MTLIREFSPQQYADALDAWQWADIADKVPLFASPFGDIFLSSADGCWFLSILDGTLTRPWDSVAELRAELTTPRGQERYLRAGLAREAERAGIIPATNQVYDFKHPPIAGGSVAVDAIRVYPGDGPRPYWHLVSFGMSELYAKVTDDPGASGWGFEFSLRVARRPAEAGPPPWSVVLLQQLARYVVAERPFAPGHTIHVARGTFDDWSSRDTGTPTELAALAFAVDPQLGVRDTPHGRVTFLQVVALTETEYAAARGGNAAAVLERVERHVPLHVVDRDRSSVL